jgi:hypothetical protein
MAAPDINTPWYLEHRIEEARWPDAGRPEQPYRKGAERALLEPRDRREAA